MPNELTNKFIKDLCEKAEELNIDVEELIKEIVQRDYRRLMERSVTDTLNQTS